MEFYKLASIYWYIDLQIKITLPVKPKESKLSLRDIALLSAWIRSNSI